MQFGRCKTRAKTVAIQGGGGNSRGSQNKSLSLSSRTGRCADSNPPQPTHWADPPEPARAPCLRVLRPRALPRDSNRLTAPCLHVPDAHLRRAICAHVAGRWARQLPMAIGRTAAALGAASGTVRRVGMAENDTVHRSPPPARRRAVPPRLGRGGHKKATTVGPRQPPPQPHLEGPLPPLRRLPRPPQARLCLFARCAPRAPHTRALGLAAPCLPLSSYHPSHPLKHTPPPTHRAWPIPHVGRRPRGRDRAAAASPTGAFFGIDSSLWRRRATVGAGWGAAGALEGGLVGGGRSQPPRRQVPAAGTGWVAPRGPETHRCPRVSMCMLVPLHGPLHLIIIVSLCGALMCILSFLQLFPLY